MRNMSFAPTKEQMLDGSKTVTRRTGWKNLKAGDRVRAVEKSTGLKKGEKVKTLCVIEIVSVRSERIDDLFGYADHGFDECRREGFASLLPIEVVSMFCRAMKCQPSTIVQRIEFRVVKDGEAVAANSVEAAVIDTKAAEHGDYDQSETWEQKFNDPPAIYRFCSDMAAEYGNYAQAETWAQKSDDPPAAYRWCADMAADHFDHAQAQRFGDLADKA